MAKKDFKIGVEKFISALDTPDTQETQGTQEPQGKPDHYRINLKLRPEYREYLTLEAWKAMKSITEYINDLIAEDKQRKEAEGRQ